MISQKGRDVTHIHAPIGAPIGYSVSQKDARFAKLKNITDLLSNDRRGKIKNIDLKYFGNQASFMGPMCKDKKMQHPV